MSRLAEVFHATGSARSAAGLTSAAPGGAKDDAAEASFQALFAQELAAPAGAASTGPVATRGDTGQPSDDPSKSRGEAGNKDLEAGAGGADLAVWLPLQTPAAPLAQSEPTGERDARLLRDLTANAARGGESALPTPGASPPWHAKVMAAELPPQPVLAPASDAKLVSGGNAGAAVPTAQAAGQPAEHTAMEFGAVLKEVPAHETGPAPASNAAVAAAPLPPAAPASPSTSVALNTHFSSPAWREDFAQQVVMIGKQDFSSAEIKLNPPQLGPIEVSIHIKNDVAEASFAAASAPVREAIEASIPRLKEMLAEAGITLGNASVSPEFGQARQAFGESQPGERRESGTSPSAPSRGGGEEAAVAVVRRRSFGTVDTFA